VRAEVTPADWVFLFCLEFVHGQSCDEWYGCDFDICDGYGSEPWWVVLWICGDGF
jgi:hypothetical protein